MVPLLIHIGFHKTGTTWLQKHVFADAARGFTSDIGAARSEIVTDFVLPGPFDPIPRATLDRYAKANATATAAGLTLVLSHERLTGYPASGAFDQKILADRLREIFPNARILIGIREQISLIDAIYSQYVTDGGTLTLERFLKGPPGPRFRRMPLFDASRYEFDKLIDYYQRLFGRENVLVLPYELLDRSPQTFADRISAFTGHPSAAVPAAARTNPRRSIAMQSVLARLNRVFTQSELNPGGWFQVPKLGRRFERTRPLFDLFIAEPWERYLQGLRRHAIEAVLKDNRFAESNTRTSHLIGFDLSHFGYPCRAAANPALPVDEPVMI